MQVPIVIERTSHASLQSQIVAQVRDLIDRGILASGSRVPSSRDLSEQLGVARRTIMLAYDKLISEGYLVSRQGAATFVGAVCPRKAIHVDGSLAFKRAVDGRTRSQPGPLNNPNLYIPASERSELDFSIGRPDHRLFPTKTWQRLVSENMAGYSRVISDYPDPQGHFGLREALCEHLRATRGIGCSPDDIVIVSGVQDGLNLVGRLLGSRSAEAVVEDPCYNGAAATFELLGMRMTPAPVDRQGIVVSNWSKDARIVYVTPSHQFPTGTTMSVTRRRELLNWVESSDAYIAEDDYDSDFRYNSSPLFALKAMDALDRVIYLGTFSKSIGPALRIGYAVFPKHLARAARELKATQSNGLPMLEQAVVSQFIRSGAFERHLVQMRRHYLARRDALISALTEAFPKTRVSGAEGGMHLIWSLGEAASSAGAFASACREIGVGIHPVAESRFCKTFAPSSAKDVMLGYTCLTETQIRQAVQRMKHVAAVRRPVAASS